MVAQMIAGVTPVPCGALGPDKGISDFILRRASKAAIKGLQKLSVTPPTRIGRIMSGL